MSTPTDAVRTLFGSGMDALVQQFCCREMNAAARPVLRGYNRISGLYAVNCFEVIQFSYTGEPI